MLRRSLSNNVQPPEMRKLLSRKKLTMPAIFTAIVCHAAVVGSTLTITHTVIRLCVFNFRGTETFRIKKGAHPLIEVPIRTTWQQVKWKISVISGLKENTLKWILIVHFYLVEKPAQYTNRPYVRRIKQYRFYLLLRVSAILAIFPVKMAKMAETFRGK